MDEEPESRVKIEGEITITINGSSRGPLFLEKGSGPSRRKPYTLKTHFAADAGLPTTNLLTAA
jgi:hypothetical protein